MKTFSIITLGCKVNQYESQQIREFLECLGLKHVQHDYPETNIVVVNTCCVTATASAKSRQSIKKTQRLSPNATIVAVGCLTSMQSGELDPVKNDIHIISNRENLAVRLRQIVNGDGEIVNEQTCQPLSSKAVTDGTSNSNGIQSARTGMPTITTFQGHTRAFLKIQDGCDGYCSYCIIPKTRPVISSKPVDTVLSEARGLVESGHKEIVLTGVFLGAYGKESVRRNRWPDGRNGELAKLLEKLAQLPGLERIRLSSLEPADVTRELMEVFCRYSNIMPHLHLSLQSGSDSILKKMGRQYSIVDFREKIKLIKSSLDRPAITCDLIVGFPSESEDDFEQTVRLAEETGFAKMHVFSFSAREGTAAAKLQHTVDTRVIKERARILGRLDRRLRGEFIGRFIGEQVEILIEDWHDGVGGRSERYFKVFVKNAPDGIKNGDLVKVKLVKNTENGAVGESGEICHNRGRLA